MWLGDGQGTSVGLGVMGVGRGSCPQSCFHHSRSDLRALHTGSGVRSVLDKFHRGWLMSMRASSLSRSPVTWLQVEAGSEGAPD